MRAVRFTGVGKPAQIENVVKPSPGPGQVLIKIGGAGTVTFLMTGRVIQGLSAACIMPATLALIKDYFDGRERQRAVSFWSIGSWGGSGVSALFGGLVASSLG